MKIRYWAPLALSAIMTLGLSSCSTFNSIFNSEKKGQKIEADVVLPRDRETIAEKPTINPYTPEEIKKGTIKGDWAIETVNEKPVVGEKAPYLKFVPTEKRVYGYNGCNYLNGPYNYNPADSTLSFGDMASTMRLCDKEGLTDYELNLALSEVKRYTWDVKDYNYYLYFFSEDGRQVMSLMHQNFDFLNGTWLVRQIDETVVNDPEMKIVIDVDEGKIHGNTGCNLYNGAMEIDMEEANSISFSAIALTRMACPDANHETELVVALEEVSSAKPVSPSEVLLFDSTGNQVLRLTRTTDQ